MRLFSSRSKRPQVETCPSWNIRKSKRSQVGTSQFWSKGPQPEVKTSSPRVKTSPSLIIYIIIVFILVLRDKRAVYDDCKENPVHRSLQSRLFAAWNAYTAGDLTTSGLLKMSVVYGHRILRAGQQEDEDDV